MTRLAVLIAVALLFGMPAGPGRAQTAETPQAVYDSFDEGFKTPDLIDTQKLLDELS